MSVLAEGSSTIECGVDCATCSVYGSALVIKQKGVNCANGRIELA